MYIGGNYLFLLFTKIISFLTIDRVARPLDQTQQERKSERKPANPGKSNVFLIIFRSIQITLNVFIDLFIKF